jgi:parvulin-like peptidyl-prolyl isomerase
MQGTAQGGEYKMWPPGQLVKEIEDAFKGCEPGEYYALIVECKNPISGYTVVKIPVS